MSVWMDKKSVTMLSTLAQPAVDKEEAERKKMTSVVLYKYMSGVDEGDQLRQYYRVKTRCTKNYKHIFDFVVDSSITNAISYSHSSATLPTTHKTLEAFRLKLTERLISQPCTWKRLKRLLTTKTLPHPSPEVHPTDDCAPLTAQYTWGSYGFKSSIQCH